MSLPIATLALIPMHMAGPRGALDNVYQSVVNESSNLAFASPRRYNVKDESNSPRLLNARYCKNESQTDCCDVTTEHMMVHHTWCGKILTNASTSVGKRPECPLNEKELQRPHDEMP